MSTQQNLCCISGIWELYGTPQGKSEGSFYCWAVRCAACNFCQFRESCLCQAMWSCYHGNQWWTTRSRESRTKHSSPSLQWTFLWISSWRGPTPLSRLPIRFERLQLVRQVSWRRCRWPSMCPTAAWCPFRTPSCNCKRISLAFESPTREVICAHRESRPCVSGENTRFRKESTRDRPSSWCTTRTQSMWPTWKDTPIWRHRGKRACRVSAKQWPNQQRSCPVYDRSDA